MALILKRFFKAAFCLLFLALLFLIIDQFFHRSNFSRNLSSPFCERILSNELDAKQIQEILLQPFSYLNKGTQCYVFVSEDSQYVMKFFKTKMLHPSTWAAYIPLKNNFFYQKHLFTKKLAEEIFKSLKIAQDELKTESALVYLHMEKTTLLPECTLLDKKGKAHSVNINNKAFFIQKKADLIYPRIVDLMTQGKTEAAKEVISSVLALLDTLAKKGIYDNDVVIHENFGLIQDQAVQIDIGQMKRNPLAAKDKKLRHQMLRSANDFYEWLQSNYPELGNHCEQKLKELEVL